LFSHFRIQDEAELLLLGFLSGNNIKLYGGGTIDGNGQVWWDQYAINQNAGTAGGSSTTFERPIPLTVGNATNVVVQDIHMINSPFWFNFVYNSKNVSYKGWDIYRSDGVSITNSNIQNCKYISHINSGQVSHVLSDDDCVSFKPNSTNVYVDNLQCDGSHGISVGSLGQYAQETDIVENIYASNINMSNAQNGARIKVFGGNPSPTSTAGGGTGYVRNITFSNFHVSYAVPSAHERHG
jgi:galacturan 1,4-alpha-galacturonidase